LALAETGCAVIAKPKAKDRITFLIAPASFHFEASIIHAYDNFENDKWTQPYSYEGLVECERTYAAWTSPYRRRLLTLAEGWQKDRHFGR
jgi:hypothetical protein